jgi:mRNA interferase MazF
MGSRSMTKHKVVLVPFPFDDLTGTKVRPAVCLTDPIGPYRHIVLAFITSSVTKVALATDLVLDTNHPDFSSTGLRVSSTLQLHRVMTATSSLIRRHLGNLSPALQADVENRLRKLFGLR